MFSETYQTPKMGLFAKYVQGFQHLTIFTKRSILDAYQCFENASGWIVAQTE